ncbi:amidohydrolase [Gordonia sp. CPCC 205515]|uniref:amidohydrolase n=1 Tax=Gordonia sp. CPCC 205515 TaxID=3140791 RepID=UPI003AF3855D
MHATNTFADTVFHNGPVLTMDSARSRTTAVAVRDGRIVALGSDASDLIGPETEVVDLHGRLLIPGFQDAHVHPVAAGLELAQCNLTECRDAESTLTAIAEYALAHPGAEWISGGGWSLEAFPGGLPTAEMADHVVPARPMYLPNRDHHGAWVNSRALELAGIDRDTPDPEGGRIERDAQGTPTGMLQESAMDLVADLMPTPSTEQMIDALLLAQEHLHSQGITAWQDAMVGPGASLPDSCDAYATIAGDGRLTARVRAAQWWDRTRGAEQIDEMISRRDRLTIGRLSAGSVKLMVDGIAESQTAALLEPYLSPCGCQGHNRGTTFIEPTDLAKYVTELDAAGFQTHFHALGDRAVRDALDAIEMARRTNGFRDTRPHLAHIQIIDPADIARFRDLGATANMQPLWAAHEPQMDELTIPVLGDERAAHQYPFGDLLRSGATLAAGSDWPVSSANPLDGIHVAVNRRGPDSAADDPVFLPQQRLDLTTAIAAYTAGSAYVNHLDETGAIRIGYYADLVVLDRDPFTFDPGAIADTRVSATYVNGKCVYRA